MSLRRLSALLVAAGLAFPATAHAPVATGPPSLREWQAKRVTVAHARAQRRPGFRVERTARLGVYRIRVCWSEPGYLGPLDGRDYGCDLVERRGYELWLRDDAVMGGFWVRWL